MSQSSTWKDVAETPAMVAYLEELLDAGFDTVRREPERLEEQGARLHRQLQDLAFHEYKSFIQSAECTKTTREQFYQMNEHIGGLLHRLPHLKQQCNEFTANVAEINAKRKANQLVLQHHAQLLELLELPQLMDTCVRNGYYDEALNVEAHVQRLKTRFEQNAIVQDIAAEVARSSDTMLAQLVAVLQTDIKLPMCLKVTGNLRRMGRFNETELRMLFLRSRDTHLTSLLATVPTADVFVYLKKYLDISRDQVFDIIMQYRAIFPDTGYSGVLHGWVVHKVSSLVGVLQRNIDLVPDGASLSTLLSQSMYFGMSLGRTGVDFRGLLGDMFEKAVLDMVGKMISTGTDHFVESIKTRKWAPSSSSTGTAVSPSIAKSPAPFATTAADDTVAPPTILVEFSHLGALCNSYIAAFNELRQVPIISIIPQLCKLLETNMNAAVAELTSIHTHKRPTMRTDEGRAFADFCKAAMDVFAPFIQQCLIALYSAQAKDIEQLLDIRRITAPLRPLVSTAVAASAAPTVSTKSSTASTPIM